MPDEIFDGVAGLTLLQSISYLNISKLSEIWLVQVQKNVHCLKTGFMLAVEHSWGKLKDCNDNVILTRIGTAPTPSKKG